ncbi:hypothetical protein CDV31_004836 [Fusarium ambrosium]|uniref:Uncharacterized protein n=1 Tax=Fusarium ambrosium TaxID=131363 RepID=A0A428UN48_9HYPO|nr:hypothetical protein CDV31_004836 [Fusarium ambrosium]
MDEALWENKVVGIFDNAQSKRFTRGSEDWLRNERTCYEEVWKIILPNQPIPTSPFYEDSVNGHPLVEVARRRLEPVFREKANRAVQSGQVASAEDYRPSQEEAMDMMAVALATLLSTRPELSQQVKDLTQSQADSDQLPPLTEDTRSTTPATSSRSHVPGTIQGPPPSTITAPQLAKIAHQTTITDTDADQRDLEAFRAMGGNAEPESPGMAFMGQPLHTTETNPQQMRTTSGPQVYVRFEIEPRAFEITLTGRVASDHFGPQKWEIAVPKGLIVEKCEQRPMELPINYGQPAMCGSFQTGISSLDPRVQGAGDNSFTLDGGWSELADISSNFFEGAQGTCPDDDN